MDSKDEQVTERDQYIEELKGKLAKIGRAQKFQESDEGKLIIETLQEQSNAVLKRIAGKKYVSDHDGYIYDLGQLHMAQRIIAVIAKDANTNPEPIRSKLDAAESGE